MASITLVCVNHFDQCYIFYFLYFIKRRRLIVLSMSTTRDTEEHFKRYLTAFDHVHRSCGGSVRKNFHRSMTRKTINVIMFQW